MRHAPAVFWCFSNQNLFVSIPKLTESTFFANTKPGQWSGIDEKVEQPVHLAADQRAGHVGAHLIGARTCAGCPGGQEEVERSGLCRSWRRIRSKNGRKQSKHLLATLTVDVQREVWHHDSRAPREADCNLVGHGFAAGFRPAQRANSARSAEADDWKWAEGPDSVVVPRAAPSEAADGR